MMSHMVHIKKETIDVPNTIGRFEELLFATLSVFVMQFCTMSDVLKWIRPNLWRIINFILFYVYVLVCMVCVCVTIQYSGFVCALSVCNNQYSYSYANEKSSICLSLMQMYAHGCIWRPLCIINEYYLMTPVNKKNIDETF